MNLEEAQELQQRFPHKKIYYDTVACCHRLIDPTLLYEYQDEEGNWHKRKDADTLLLCS